MTGNTTQVALDAVDLLRPEPDSELAPVRARLARTVRGILWFAAGCGVAALLYYFVGLWCLALPVVVATATAILRDAG